MSKSNFQATNYIDDIIGHAVCSQAYDSFHYLYKLLIELGFDISEKSSHSCYQSNMSGSRN